jgi:hypothetical protein
MTAIWGLSMLLGNLGLDAAWEFIGRTWPAVFVIVGITLLIHRDPSRNRYAFWGTFWMLAGACAYVSQQDWIHVSFWGLLAPILLVLLGASFVYRAVRGTRVGARRCTNTNLD